MGGLDAEREVIDIVRVIRLGKTDTVMSCLGDRFQDGASLSIPWHQAPDLSHAERAARTLST